MADYKSMRNFILQLTSRTDLTLESTLRDARDRIPREDWSKLEELAGNFNEETTILEVLAAIQSADASPDND